MRLLLVFVLCSLGANLMAQDLKLMTLNLHGFHPTGEAPRFFEYKDGSVEETSSHIHYFTPEELLRGHKRRIDELSGQITKLAPSVILLQEVGAGAKEIGEDKSCADFYRVDQSPWRNTALQLKDKLQELGFDYSPLLACRGNIGWWSGPNDLVDKRIVSFDKDGNKTVQFDFGSNPYPSGILVEGFAILVHNDWQVLDHKIWQTTYNYKKEKIFYQTVAISQAQSDKWYLIANIHGGHKLAAFEQAVTMRLALSRYVKQKQFSKKSFGGFVLAGDYNARSFRPRRTDELSEISLVPYEIKRKGVYDFNLDSYYQEKMSYLRESLSALNFDQEYKPWATVTDEAEVNQRIDDALKIFSFWQRKTRETMPEFMQMDDIIQTASEKNLCNPIVDLDGACHRPDRIDFIFTTKAIETKEASILYNNHSWTATSGVTDHPGLWATLKLN